MGFSRQEYWSGVPLPSLAVILEPPKIKSVTVSTVSPSICHEMMGPGAMVFVFWTFSLSSFTFIKRLYSSSSLSATRVVSPAYLRLLIFLPAILILACASSCHFSLKSVYVRMHFGKYYLILIHLPAEITCQLKRNDKITVFCILMVSGRSINSTS